MALVRRDWEKDKSLFLKKKDTRATIEDAMKKCGTALKKAVNDGNAAGFVWKGGEVILRVRYGTKTLYTTGDKAATLELAKKIGNDYADQLIAGKVSAADKSDIEKAMKAMSAQRSKKK